jgi:nucleotide-binding universal stress UspA family protein
MWSYEFSPSWEFERNTMNAIVVGTDQSPQARIAVDRAARMATQYQVPLHIVTGLRKDQAKEFGYGDDRLVLDNIDIAKRALVALAGEFKHVGAVTVAALDSDPISALCDEATRLNASAIVVGNKRVQGVGRVLGSVAAGVLKSAPCDVLVVHTQD